MNATLGFLLPTCVKEKSLEALYIESRLRSHTPFASGTPFFNGTCN